MNDVAYLHYGSGLPGHTVQNYYVPATGSWPSTNKRTQIRAAQACKHCRTRKQKCDEGHPCCHCKAENVACEYQWKPPAKKDENAENVEKLQSGMQTFGKITARILAKLETYHRRVEQNSHQQNRRNALQVVAGANVAVTKSNEPLSHNRRNALEDHRTAPHKLLLLWPTVRPLLDLANVDPNDGYVMEAEDRGVLRLWTRGEGIDEYDSTQPGGPASPAWSEDSADPTNATTLHAEGIWGAGFPSTPNSEARRPEPHSAGGLRLSGEVDLDVGTINMLYDSYMKSIHIMHPFMDRGWLRRMFDEFIERYYRPRAAFAVGMNSYDSDSRPLKRQRSNGSTTNIGTTGSDTELRREPTERSPGNAIIYLVLALGKICLHREPIPGMLRDSKANANNRNMDVIPGLAYYAKAAEILGDQGDGNSLVHAQMFLLAGLYKGQLARVKESMSWFTMASRAIQMLLDRYELYNNNYWEKEGGDVQQQHQSGQARIKDTRQSLIVLASWTCLQLESDILAELRLPSSNIQSIEHLLLLPRYVEEEDTYTGLESDRRPDDRDVLLYYTAQLYMRRRLNKVHQELYGSECLGQPLSKVLGIVTSHQAILREWREELPPLLKWDDDDPPPSDILAARLRAKYWGAECIINRPFLDYVLHIIGHVKGNPHVEIESVARDAYGNPRDKADIHLFKAIRQLPESEIWKAAQCCIRAAMKSTVAFDGMPDRLIVTNIHGTAHSQFGNMLVLSATFKSTYFRYLVPPGKLQELLGRTIKFLRRLSPISPTCAADCGILEKFNSVLFPECLEEPDLYKDEGLVYAQSESETTSFNADT